MPSEDVVTQLPHLPRRAPDSNKGQFGRVLIVAGSRGMSGAAVLCGSAALRAGAGLVRVAVPSEVLSIVAMGNPCYMTAPLPCDELGRLNHSAVEALTTLAQAHDVVALGPGLGRSDDLTRLVGEVISKITQPLVVDADALNALAEQPSQLEKHAGPVIVTPHPGEFGRLLQISATQVQAKRRELAVAFAGKHQVVVVLKGHGTVVTDGRRVYITHTGNPGMATAGSGDVLTGTIAALLGQKLDAFAAAQLGVHAHGLAGDLVRQEQGEIGMIATDLIAFLPEALRTLSGG